MSLSTKSTKYRVKFLKSSFKVASLYSAKICPYVDCSVPLYDFPGKFVRD